MEVAQCLGSATASLNRTRTKKDKKRKDKKNPIPFFMKFEFFRRSILKGRRILRRKKERKKERKKRWSIIVSPETVGFVVVVREMWAIRLFGISNLVNSTRRTRVRNHRLHHQHQGTHGLYTRRCYRSQIFIESMDVMSLVDGVDYVE